jgi:hypothetical protein
MNVWFYTFTTYSMVSVTCLRYFLGMTWSRVYTLPFIIPHEEKFLNIYNDPLVVWWHQRTYSIYGSGQRFRNMLSLFVGGYFEGNLSNFPAWIVCCDIRQCLGFCLIVGIFLFCNQSNFVIILRLVLFFVLQF